MQYLVEHLIILHLIAFGIGVILDRIIGDPANKLHPIRWIGAWIALGEKVLLTEQAKKKKSSGIVRGLILVITVTVTVVCVTTAVLFAAYRIHPYLGAGVEAVLTCFALAAKSLKKESRKVYDALKTKTIEDARNAVAMIVGRDTQNLDAEGIIRATIETVAENTSDGVIAPMLYLFFGGPIAGYLYKAVNTMDSMVGYHSERYEYFGKIAARVDDVLNFIPSRLSALLMILSAYVAGAFGKTDMHGSSGERTRTYSGSGAGRIFMRDRYQHKSPNSAQTESACAGALSVRLAGNASYFGKKVEKPWIGDDIRPIEAEDILRACTLMDLTELFCVILLGLAAALLVLA